MDVVGNVNVGTAVAVDVRHRHAEPVSDFLQDTCLLGDVGKRAIAIVAIELIVAVRCGGNDAGRVFGHGSPREVFRGVVEQEQVETSIAVVIEEHGVRGKAGIVDVVLRGGFGEGAIAVVDEQQIPALLRPRPGRSGHGDIDVEVTVVVDVDHGDAGRPAMGLDARGLRDVLEPHVALIQVEAARDLIAGEEDVGEAVVVDVADRDAGAIVDVRHGQRVERITRLDGVGERDAGLRWTQSPEDRRLSTRLPAARAENQNPHPQKSHGGVMRVSYSAT